MSTIKVKIKSNKPLGGSQRVLTLEINGQAVAATDPKTVKAIATAFGSKNTAPHELKMNSVSLKGFEMELKGDNVAVLKSGTGNEISKKVNFANGATVKLVVNKKGMLSKIFTGKFYTIKAKIK